MDESLSVIGTVLMLLRVSEERLDHGFGGLRVSPPQNYTGLHPTLPIRGALPAYDVRHRKGKTVGLS